MNKRGEAPGFAWIIGLLLLLGLALGYVVLNQTLTVHVLPQADIMINNSPHLNATERADIIAENNKYMDFWHSMPYIIVFLIVIYMIVTSIRKE